MIPTFTLPIGFLALLALPVLVGIYLLRTRSRRYPVSSLMLWVNQKQARQGGLRIERLQTPLLFLLELLTIIFLALAIAAPIIRTSKGRTPLIIILDDSFSMRAGTGDSPRSRATKALGELLAPDGFNPLATPRYGTRFVLAGTEPRLLNEEAKSAGEAIDELVRWRCLSASADLDAAMTFAAALGDSKAIMLVVTDEPPEHPLESERIQWWSFGTSQSNMAFVNATRNPSESGERCLFEISNLSGNARTTELVVESVASEMGNSPVRLHHSTPEIRPMETHRVILNLPRQTPAIRAHIGEDSLSIDNNVVLIPQIRKPVHVEVRIQDQRLRSLVNDALEATKRSIAATTLPELIFLDQATLPDGLSGAWLMHILIEPRASAYLGPFVVNHTHPLTEGLSFNGVVWGAGTTEQIIGIPIITAGNVPLLTDTERFSGIREIRLRLRPDLSTLQTSPNWPALIWNLLEWRASELPGLVRSNLRLGDAAVLNIKAGVESIRIVSPSGDTHDQHVLEREVNVSAGEVGIYKVEAGIDEYTFASNALRQSESDLRSKASGRWGDWGDTMLERWGFRGFSWFFLLLAIAALTLHLILSKRET
ncbi:MAG: BatA domain-containing protein [Candidatus Poribacteria bacterium]|nr:BatA domain-containing protein [Candidatus Poribacteria bacterium]MDE0503147.1 BatA domain-containing protein [Candidatus Poribacteria bacterium]